MAVLGLHCCTQTFFSCGKQGLLSSCGVWSSHCSGFSWLQSTGLVVPQHVGSSPTRDRTRVSCVGRWILNCTTRQASNASFYSHPCSNATSSERPSLSTLYKYTLSFHPYHLLPFPMPFLHCDSHFMTSYVSPPRPPAPQGEGLLSVSVTCVSVSTGSRSESGTLQAIFLWLRGRHVIEFTLKSHKC